MITSAQLRQKYFDFFKSKGHALIPSASLIPENDPTVLFTTAGMHPLVPYLLGEAHPLGKRLCDVQKCIRTGDIDDVGDAWHLSFFEMLGNWSLGDYFKKEMVAFSYEFLTGKKYLGIPSERLSVTCFAGDADAPRDIEAAGAWEKAGVPKNRIHFLAKADNWWGPAGQTGPCGPDTEMFYHVKDIQEKSTQEFEKYNKEGTFCEIWNDVLMQYNKNEKGVYEEGKQKNIDTGMGVERTVAVLNGLDNVYETDTLKPIFEKVLDLAGKKSGKVSAEELRSARIITDHLRAAVMILGDNKGIVPSNVDQGYILRRFIRRAIRHARLIGINGNFCKEVAQVTVKVMGPVFEEVEKNKARVFSELEKEEEKFSVALENGTKVLEKKLSFLDKAPKKELNAKGAFDLFQSYGFPLEMTIEMCKEKGFSVDSKRFEELLKQHQELSRKGAEQKFKGGLLDNSVETTKLHTATHLLNEALRQIVRKDTYQKGCNITAERLRFDFNADEKLTEEQLKKVEAWVNDAIKSEAEVKMDIMGVEEAKKVGAQGVFDSKYGEKVKVYTISKGSKIFSKEICGGPHVKNTKELGKFKIQKQESVAAGIRRIKAVLE
ncbi:Alanine--tRNA ligase [uncultured archaeon]|nr:Alanine--tRNA ligase [uncultured archaeon]